MIPISLEACNCSLCYQVALTAGASPHTKIRSAFSDLPDSRDGNILFITHSRKAATAVVGNQVNKVVKVDGLDIPGAISILRHSLLKKSLLTDEETVKELLSELSGLPLGIQQAATYLNNHAHLTISKFLDLLRSPSQDAFPLISQRTDEPSEGTDPQVNTLKITIRSFGAIQKVNPHAGALLEFVSQIGPSFIPRTILAGAGIKVGKIEVEESIQCPVYDVCW